jgi:hypothetical protein
MNPPLVCSLDHNGGEKRAMRPFADTSNLKRPAGTKTCRPAFFGGDSKRLATRQKRFATRQKALRDSLFLLAFNAHAAAGDVEASPDHRPATRNVAFTFHDLRKYRMDPFFFVNLPDGTKQRLVRFDDAPARPAIFDLALGPQELIRLPVGRTVTLMQAGAILVGGKNTLPDITSSDDHVVKVGRRIRRHPTEQAFEASATGEGFAWLSCMAGADNAGASLGVCAGKIENHTDMTIDMIADAFRKGDAIKIVQLQRLLDNNSDNLFNENSVANERHWGQLACGTVAKVGGIKTFSSKTNYTYHSYHVPLRKVERRSDVTYRPGVIGKAAAAIKAKLKTGVPVLVGVVYDPSTAMLSGGELEVTRGGGHTVLIVGCNDNATKFLYIDPFPQSSKLRYEGGTRRFPFDRTCDFLGTFEIGDLEGRTGILRQSAGCVGVLGELEVVSGPRA